MMSAELRITALGYACSSSVGDVVATAERYYEFLTRTDDDKALKASSPKDQASSAAENDQTLSPHS